VILEETVEEPKEDLERQQYPNLSRQVFEHLDAVKVPVRL
jgi:hypothetical protein